MLGRDYVLLLKTTALGESGNKISKLSGATIPPSNHTDSRFLPMVVRALSYYQRMVNNLSSNEEGEPAFHEGDPFGDYLVSNAKEAAAVTRELKENPHDVTKLVKEDKYRLLYSKHSYFTLLS